MDYRPLEMFVLCDSGIHAKNLMIATVEAIKKYQALKLLRSPHHEVFRDGDPMTIVLGFVPYRLAFGTRSFYNRCCEAFPPFTIMERINESKYNPDEFIKQFAEQENLELESYNNVNGYKIDISVPIMDRQPDLQHHRIIDTEMGFKKLIELKKLDYRMGYTMKGAVKIFIIGEIVRVRFFHSDIPCVRLLSSDYRGDIYTEPRFFEDMRRIVTRILRAVRKHERAKKN